MKLLALVLGMLLIAPSTRAQTLELGQNIDHIADLCELEFKGLRDGLRIYTCGWIDTPWGLRYAGVGADNAGIIQAIILVNVNETETAAAGVWLRSAYAHPAKIKGYFDYWRTGAHWVCLTPRDGRATAVEITARNPRSVVASVTGSYGKGADVRVTVVGNGRGGRGGSRSRGGSGSREQPELDQTRPVDVREHTRRNRDGTVSRVRKHTRSRPGEGRSDDR